MAISKLSANIILSRYCHGLVWNKDIGRYLLDFMSIDRRDYDFIRSEVRRYGERLTIEDINEFVTLCLSEKFPSAVRVPRLPMGLICTGEILNIVDSANNDLTIMKMSADTFLMLHTDYKGLSGQMLQTPKGYVFDSDCELPVNGSSIVVERLYVQPPDYAHRLIDKIWMNRLPDYTCTDSLWGLYNDLIDNFNCLGSMFRDTLQHFEEAGMSSFVMTNLINTIARNRKAYA